MQFEIRVQAMPGRYQLWFADDTNWAPVFISQGSFTADEVCAAITERAERLGWENFPEKIWVLDERRGAVSTPEELLTAMDRVFREADRRRGTKRKTFLLSKSAPRSE